jgi:hypothetical protein
MKPPNGPQKVGSSGASDFAQIAIQALQAQPVLERMQRCIRFIGQNLAYKSYEAFQAIKKMAAFGTLESRYEQSPSSFSGKNFQIEKKIRMKRKKCML